jgi:pSer/pThr/pTyr-binding forkhead associated (FHA) protein
MRVTLEIVSGPQSGRKLVIGSGYAVQVGRTEWADFALSDDAQMSTVHFTIECNQHACRIRDLHSTNGTRVNGRTVSEAVLHDQDRIDAGQTGFVVHVEEAAPAPPPAPSLPRSTQVAGLPATPRDADPPGAIQPPPQPPQGVPHLRQTPPPIPTAPPADVPVSPGPQETRVMLEVVDGPCEKRIFTLREGQVVHVGRTEWADLAFAADGKMSSRHFVLEYERGVCRLRDLNSTNGTLVNGNRVAETVLADADKIHAGQTVFLLHIEGGRPLPSAAAASPAACFRTAMEDEDPAVRRDALLAAVWTRQPWVLEHCRKLGARPSPEHWDAMLFLAVLGKPQDLRTILAIGQSAELGPRRFQVPGAYGHPAVVEMLLAAMGSDDPAAAVAAAEAFKKITGADVDSDRRAAVPADDGSQPDAAQPESRIEAVLPDAKRARAHWDRVKATVSQWTRACRGLDLSTRASEETLSQLDMQSRWEAVCREQFEGTRVRSLVELEALRIP